MKDVRWLLESERETEWQFVLSAAGEPGHSGGWTAALLMFHVARWRERLGAGLTQLREGRTVEAPPQDVDAVNARELPQGRHLSLDETATRSDASVGQLIELWAALGDRPFQWYWARTTGEALIRISYFHPRNHLAEYLIERGDRVGGSEIYEESAAQLRRADAPGHTLGPALYNLACAWLAGSRSDEALKLLEEALPMRSDLPAAAAANPDLAPLKSDARFQALIDARR